MGTIKRIAEKIGTIRQKQLEDDEAVVEDGAKYEAQFKANLMDSIQRNDVHELP